MILKTAGIIHGIYEIDEFYAMMTSHLCPDACLFEYRREEILDGVEREREAM